MAVFSLLIANNCLGPYHHIMRLTMEQEIRKEILDIFEKLELPTSPSTQSTLSQSPQCFTIYTELAPCQLASNSNSTPPQKYYA